MCLCVCMCVCVEMVDLGESEEMIKISGKVDKSNTYNGFSSNISFWRSFSLYNERNITTKPVVSVWLIYISGYFYKINLINL